MRLVPVVAFCFLAVVLAGVAPAATGTRRTTTLVELLPSAGCTDALLVHATGGIPVAPTLGLYTVSAKAARHLVATLRARRDFRWSAPNPIEGSLAANDFADPLVQPSGGAEPSASTR